MLVMMHNQIATVHPRRVPLHNEPGKDQIFAGTCNSTGCETTGVTQWCALNRAFFCDCCAAEINDGPAPSCEQVSAKPSLAEMDIRYRYAIKAFRN